MSISRPNMGYILPNITEHNPDAAGDNFMSHLPFSLQFSILYCSPDTQCFLDGQVDGKGPKAFDAGRFTHCGKNYQDGFQRAVRVKVMMHKD
jgi:hypothetical protein